MLAKNSLRNSLLLSSPAQRLEAIKGLSEAEAEQLLYDWPLWARPEQLEPPGDWIGWLPLAGRGWGKTRTGSEWVRGLVEASPEPVRIALVAETSADGRDVMVEGDSGVIAVSPPWSRPLYEPSKRRLTWPNGSIATLYDAREPDQLRGPQHHFAWMDELAKFRYGREVYDNLMMGLRLGSRPRWLATTTPRPTELIKAMIRDPAVKVTRHKTKDNLANLAPTFRKAVVERYAGTRLGRQELDAEVLEDVPGALWTRRNIDEYRRTRAEMPALRRIVVAIDPAVTATSDSDETGIVVCGVDAGNRGYVVDDQSIKGAPEVWARRAVAAYRQYSADAIVVETNQGGDMAIATIRAIDAVVPIKNVHASRGKFIRAEPISALYEQGRISHVGTFAQLEDQMCGFSSERGSAREDGYSPDRVDAVVWAFTELFGDMIRPPVSQAKDALMRRLGVVAVSDPIDRDEWTQDVQRQTARYGIDDDY